MSEIRVKNLGSETLIIIDNSSGIMYDNSKISWSGIEKEIAFSYDGEEVFKAAPSEFFEPKEKSLVDLLIKLYNLTNIENGLGGKANTSTKEVSADYVAKAGDFVVVTTGATDKTIKLPPNPTKDDYLEILKYDYGLGDVIVDGNGELINGETSTILSRQFYTLRFHYTGTQWLIK